MTTIEKIRSIRAETKRAFGRVLDHAEISCVLKKGEHWMDEHITADLIIQRVRERNAEWELKRRR